jgi:hypothetical protein
MNHSHHSNFKVVGFDHFKPEPSLPKANPVEFDGVGQILISSNSMELKSTNSTLIIQNSSLAAGAPEGLGYGK